MKKVDISKIKPLHVIDSGGLYGAEKMLINLMRQQKNSGINPVLISVGNVGVEQKRLEEEVLLEGFDVICWRMKSGLNLFGAIKIIKWAKENEVNLLHSHGYKFNILFGLIPKIFRKLPLIVTLHGYVKSKKLTKMWLYEIVDRIALRAADKVVVVAERMLLELPKSIVSRNKVEVIRNGIDIEDLRFRSIGSVVPENISGFIDRHSPTILFAGRISSEKGIVELISSIKKIVGKFPDAGFLMAGDGQLRPEMQKLLKDNKLDSYALMTGYCPFVPSLMRRCDILIMPSLTEGLPIALLEAMALGIPIIASPVGDIAVVLGEGEGGVLLECRSADCICRAITKCMSLGGEKINWSKCQVENNFSSNSMSKKYIETYHKTLRI